MYIIYMILSLLGITSPFATNESTHGEKRHTDTSQVMSDMMANYHGRAESVCLSQSAIDIESCKGGLVKQDNISGSKATYGIGVVSLSNGKDNVVTFIPESENYRFDPGVVKGDVYNRLSNITGQALNIGYYDASLNSIIMKDGSDTALPDGMAGYQLYDHMPVLLTNLKGSQAATTRGDNSIVASNTTVMDSLRTGAKKFDQQQQLYEQSSSNYTCADGSTGAVLGNSIMCGTGDNNSSSAASQEIANSVYGASSSVNEETIANTNSGGGSQTPTDSDSTDNDNNVYAVNYSNDYTMKMGSSANNTQGNQAGAGAQDNKDSDDSDTDPGLNVNDGDHVPMTGTYLNNCQNVVYPEADPSAATFNNLGYTYQYDYYVDLDNCNTFIRPSLDNENNNYAVTPTDTIPQNLGWSANTHDYEWFDWFGVDTEGFGVRNPSSSKWNLISTDCGLNLGYSLYTASYSDLETVVEQDRSGNLSQSLTDCSRTGTGNETGSYGGDNGYNLSEVNSLITQGINGNFGNTGPYFNQPFTYWGMSWLCKPEVKDTNGPYLHYLVVCAPTINVTSQDNDYSSYNSWKNFVGTGNYPYGGFFSFGHKGSTNLGGSELGNSMTLTANNPNIQEGQDVNFGVSSTGSDYTGQAFGGYRPFVIQTNTPVNGLDAVSSVLRNNNATCNAVNAANISDITPSGSCSGLMSGIPFAFNKEFFDFEQNFLKSVSKMMVQNDWQSATSTLNGNPVAGTAGYPQQDGDGVWRWYIAPIIAPSFPTPSGTEINATTDKKDIKVGTYFTVDGETDPTTAGIYNGNNAVATDTSSVPTVISWQSGSVINGSSSQNPQTNTSKGYGYICNLGTYEGYDYATGKLKYTMNCTIKTVPDDLGDFYGSGPTAYAFTVACKDQPYVKGVFTERSSYGDDYMGEYRSEISADGANPSVYHYVVYDATAHLAKELVSYNNNSECTPLKIDSLTSSVVYDPPPIWTNTSGAIDFPDWAYQGAPTHYCDDSDGLFMCLGKPGKTIVDSNILSADLDNYSQCTHIDSDGYDCGFGDIFSGGQWSVMTRDGTAYTAEIPNAPDVSFTYQPYFCSLGGLLANLYMPDDASSGMFTFNVANCTGFYQWDGMG